MGAPATTGQLRTKVSEMEIGDYIICEGYQYAKTVVPTIRNLGTSIASEAPLGGVTPPASGSVGAKWSFYFVKVAKGLLIGDRVLENTISWDTLNSSKVIQGLPWDNGNIIPTMTSNTSPSGIASASGVFTGIVKYEPWKAFDKKITDYQDRWVTEGTSGWISYEFETHKVITQYTLVCSNSSDDGIISMAKDWTFEGWNGSEWIILDTQKGITNWQSGVKKQFSFNNKKAYKIYRVNVTANNGGNYVSIYEIEMFETAGIIRSLTGGVAYTDANGNKSLTDKGFGGWPVNNEWDKYIVNFPVGKIQEGKTLDDVFHWSVSSTWTQETPTNGATRIGSSFIGTSSRRVYRSYRAISGTDEKLWVFNDSSLSDPTVGFRPVFEYKE